MLKLDFVLICLVGLDGRFRKAVDARLAWLLCLSKVDAETLREACCGRGAWCTDASEGDVLLSWLDTL